MCAKCCFLAMEVHDFEAGCGVRPICVLSLATRSLIRICKHEDFCVRVVFGLIAVFLITGSAFASCSVSRQTLSKPRTAFLAPRPVTWYVSGAGDPDSSRIRHEHERQRGPDGFLQNQYDGKCLSHRDLSNGILPGERCAPHHHLYADRILSAGSTGLHDRHSIAAV